MFETADLAQATAAFTAALGQHRHFAGNPIRRSSNLYGDDMGTSQLKELLLQAFEHEKGGVLVYEMALNCAINPDLRKEWAAYMDQTRTHVQVLADTLRAFEIDLYEETPGRQVVRYLGAALVQAMRMALSSAPPEAAQLVACECIVFAETKDHLDWELIGKCVAQAEGRHQEILEAAYAQIEDQEDEHLYHTKGWCRELWLDSLGLPAVLLPQEEVMHVTTALEAAEVEKQRLVSRHSQR
jgi:hypothetical protein